MPTVLIHNQSGGSGKIYNVWSESPGVSGGGFQSTKSMVWYKSRPLANNAQDVFRFSPEYYAFVGSSESGSSQLPNGDNIYLQDSEQVKLGTQLDDGNRFIVDKNLNTSLMDSNAVNGNFRILSKADVQSPNRNVVGLARLQDGESMPAPVAAVELKRGVGIGFSPKQGVIVSSTTWEQGTVQSLDGGDYKQMKVEFNGSQSKAIVSETSSGDFKVSYK
ncbi:hypothetical protein FQN54_004469 [Arachnomyces sp. PD_36]|nr:hypothetical protein FQN54_004469 [Arachnomyces sp. PD_36]